MAITTADGVPEKKIQGTQLTDDNLAFGIQEHVSREDARVSKARQLAIIVFIVSLLLIAMPFLYLSIRIHRADLPEDRISQSRQTWDDHLNMNVPVYTGLLKEVAAVQHELDNLIDSRFPMLRDSWRLTLHEGALDSEIQIAWDPNSGPTASHPKLLTISESALNPAHIAATLFDVFKEEMEQIVNAQKSEPAKKAPDVAMAYSPSYNVIFSLLSEGGTHVYWDIEAATKLLEPVFSSLSHYANFSVASQVQYYSQLASLILFDNSSNSFPLTDADLTTFINFGDWNLDTHDMTPTLNFLVYLPECLYNGKQMRVESGNTNLFLVPQWGGVHILQLPVSKGLLLAAALEPIMKIFTSQLFELLGVPHSRQPPRTRVDALSRILIVRNVRASLANLESLVKLTKLLQGISVPEETREFCDETLALLDQCLLALKKGDYVRATTHAGDALVNSNKAFFEKEMVQQAYFPSEHRMAVLFPLLGPLTSIALLSIIKILSGFKGKRKAD